MSFLIREKRIKYIYIICKIEDSQQINKIFISDPIYTSLSDFVNVQGRRGLKALWTVDLDGNWTERRKTMEGFQQNFARNFASSKSNETPFCQRRRTPMSF